MNTIDLVDPELRPLLDLFPTKVLTHENLAEARARVLPVPDAKISGVSVSSLTIPSRSNAPDIRLHIYKPEATGPLSCIFHIHGGGYVMGAAKDVAPMYIPLAIM